MARTSPVHYIAPSAISITPNANNSSNDLAVYVAKGAKIKVHSNGISQLGFDLNTNTWQEWTMSGRNRRLNPNYSDRPFTIYARLRKTDKSKGYLVFAAKEQVDSVWKDKYAYVTVDGLATDTINSDDNTYWWIKLGEVSVPESGERTVTLDTGILGTDQYNNEWYLNPDDLPLRIELSSTIDNEEKGSTPYVAWGQQLVLSAKLVEGWTETDVERFDHWTILRNTGDVDSDGTWPDASRAASFASTGTITLSHTRGSGDDFNGAVATTFKVTAWGASEPLATIAITVLAETVESYELELSDSVVTYDPKTNTYSPAAGVTVSIRAKAQDGSVFYLDQAYINTARLHVYYLPADQDEETATSQELVFSNGVATLPISAFHGEKNINLRLENEARVVLGRATVGYVRYGEDGTDGQDTAMAVCMPAVVSIPTDGNGLAKEDFEQTVTVVIYTNSSDLTSPEIQVTAGGVNVEVSDASLTPYGSGDITFNGETSVFANGEFDGETLVLGEGTSFSTGTLRVTAKKGDAIDEHLCQLMVYGYDTDGTQYRARTSLGIQRNVRGTDGDTPLAVYAWNQNPDTAPAISGNALPPAGWTTRITSRPGDGWYLWMAESTRHSDGSVDAWGVPVRITGEDGNPGADAKDMEWIYRLDTDSGYNGTTGTAPDTDPDSPTYGQRIAVSGDARYTTDDFVPTDWSDNPLSVSNDHKTEYASFRKYNTSTGRWGDFSEPVVWSHWGDRGVDGDGVEYVFIRTDSDTAPTITNSDDTYDGKTYLDDDYRPLSSAGRCTDDAVGVDSTHKYEWAISRTKTDPDSNGVRTWTKYSGTMKLWATYSENITKQSETAYYIKNTTGVRPAEDDSGWSTTKPTVGKGEWLFTKTVITWSDGSTTVIYTDSRNPNDGVAGQDIIVDGSTVMKYYVGDSNTTHPADGSSDWKDLSQVTQTQGKWLWSQATTYYRKASSTAGSHDAGSSINYSVSYISKDGANGRGIKASTELYQATSSSAARQKPTSDSGWSTDPNLSDLTNKWTETYKYLWNCEKTVYTNSDGSETTEYTVPRVIAIWTKDGDAGRGIDSIVNYYAINNDPDHAPTSGWDDDPIAPTEEQPFLWNYERVNWTSGTPAYTETEPHVIGHYGADGNDVATAICMPAVVSIPTDSSGRVIEDFEQEVAIVVYTNDDDLDCPNIEVTAGGANVEIDSAGIKSHTDSGITFSDETTIVANGEFSDETLVLGDDSVTIQTGSIKVKAKAGDLLTEHVCELTAWGYDDDGKEYRAYTTLSIQRNVRGADGETPLAVYAWNEDPDTAPLISGNDYPPAGWTTRITSRPGDGWYLWMAESTRHSDGTIDVWGIPVRITGEDGNPGADAKDMEWIYRLDTDSGYNGTTGTAPDTDPDSPTYGQRIAVSGDARYTTDDFVPTDWSDNPLSVSDDHKTEYASCRKYNTSTGRWGEFSEPAVWSHWGERGVDGDGVEYVFIRTNSDTAPTITNSDDTYDGKTYLDDDYRPLSSAGRCTDDAVGVDSTHKYEWAISRTKTDPDSNGVRTWTKYSGTMKLWATYSESITKQSETAYYIKNTTGVRPAEDDSGWSTTKPTVGKGEWLFTKTVITWSDGSTTVLYTDSRNPNDGVAGQDIIVDGSTVMKYYVGDSNTTHPADGSSDWKDLSQVTQTQGKWLWSQATTYYRKASSTAGSHDAGSSINYSVSYISKDGKTGRGIKSSTELYQATSSSAARQKPTSDSGWSTDPNLSDLTNKWTETYKYLWNCEKTVYTNSDGSETTEYTTPRVIAIWTKDGDAGRGIDSIVNYYAINNDPDHAPTSGWDDDPMAPTEEQPFLWNYERVNWTSGTPAYTETDPHVIGHYGADGNDAPQIAFLPAMIVVPCDDSGTYTLHDFQQTVSALMTVNGTAATGVSITAVSYNGTASVGISNGNVTFQIGIDSDSADWESPVTATVQGTVGGKIYTGQASIPVVASRQGNVGSSVYALSSSASTVKLTKDYAGVVTANPSVFNLSLQYDGESVRPPGGYYIYLRRDGGSWTRSTLGSFTTTTLFDNGSYTTVEYAFCNGNPNNGESYIIDRTTVTAVWEIQRMLVPAGAYEDKKYERTVNTTPLVLHDGTYWFLVAGDNSTDNPTTFVAPGSSSSVWQQASEYEVILTKMLFAKFANLGSFIVYGQYFFSQYGQIINASGTVVQAIDANNTDFDGQIGYSYFDPADPMATIRDTSQGRTVWFRPTKCINALTGEEWGASGNVHFSPNGDTYIKGEVHATSGDFDNVKISGGIRSPFYFVNPDRTFEAETTDNMSILTIDDSTSFNLPWDVAQSGRRITIVNYMWGGLSYSTGYAKITVPTKNQFFFEDGAQKTSLIVATKEVVELLGYGDGSIFFGWIVMNRLNISTSQDYGRPQNVLAKGIVTGGTSPSVRGYTYKGVQMQVERISTGKYRLGTSDAHFSNLHGLVVLATGIGLVDNNPVAANVTSYTGQSVDIQTFTSAGLVDGNFSFMIMNVDDNAHLAFT